MNASGRPEPPRIEVLGVESYDDVIALWCACGLPVKPNGRDSRREMERQLALPQVKLLGARDGQGLAGAVLATHDGRKGWINRLAVRADRRRRGLGLALLRAAEGWLEGQGIGIFAAIVEAGNDASSALMARAGYLVFEGASYLTRRLDPDV